ncbi:MAG: methyltransferase [Caldilineaceae bacterium]
MGKSDPQPTTINRLTAGFYPAMALLAGVQLDLFTVLRGDPLSAGQIAIRLQLDPGKLRPLLYALCKAGLLKVEDNHFSNTAEADYFLVRGKPTFMDSLGLFLTDFWGAAWQSAATIRTGLPQASHSATEEQAFIHYLDARNRTVGKQLSTQFDLSPYKTVVDVAGGAGGLALALVEAYPQLEATIIDLPTVTPLAEAAIAAAEATQQVRSLAVDLLREPLPGTYDVAVLHRFTNVLGAEAARRVIHKVGAAVNPGGMVIIRGPILDDSRLSPAAVVDVNLALINLFAGGEAHTEGEHRAWLTEAGFTAIERIGPDLVVAQKAA